MDDVSAECKVLAVKAYMECHKQAAGTGTSVPSLHLKLRDLLVQVVRSYDTNVLIMGTRDRAAQGRDLHNHHIEGQLLV